MSGRFDPVRTSLGEALCTPISSVNVPAQRVAFATPVSAVDMLASAQGVALGHAVRRRAGDVAAAVVASWCERRTPSNLPDADVVAVITQTCSLGTELVGRYLETGEGATPEEAKTLANSGKLAMAHAFALADITMNYFTWRDVTVRVLLEEGQCLGVARSVLTEAAGVTHFMGDASHVRMARRFDDERRALQEQLDRVHAKLTHLALHDPLTGLPNRTLLLDRLAHAMGLLARSRRPVTVLYLDLDDFKAVNDRFGHAVGDRVLVAVAERLAELMRPSDTVARLGGDEFVVLCEDLDGGEAELAALTERIRDGVAGISSPWHDAMVSVSIGVAIAHAGTDPEHILNQADLAMYAAKRQD